MKEIVSGRLYLSSLTSSLHYINSELGKAVLVLNQFDNVLNKPTLIGIDGESKIIIVDSLRTFNQILFKDL